MEQISQKILCVDDEPNLLDGLKRQLRRYEVTTALGPAAALETIRTHGPFAVVMSDYNMPQMSGAELLAQVQLISPETVTVMLTGCADLAVAISALHQGRIFRFLNKPCSREALEATLRDALEQYQLVVSRRLLTAALNEANDNLRALNQTLEERVRERTATIARLHQFVSELSRLDSVPDVAALVVQTTAEMLNSRRVSLMVPDAGNEYLMILAGQGIESELKDCVRVPVGEGISGRAFADCTRIVVNQHESWMRAEGRYESDFFAVVPLVSAALMTSTQTVGVLNVTEHADGLPYDEADLATLKAISEATAVALQNQIRRQERDEARDGVILALAKLAENRDPETGAHLERVQIYCRVLGEALARMPKYAPIVDEEFISALVRSSPLHDIGKVGIPDRILLKPGRLTKEEFEVMKTHTTIGGNTIRTLVDRRRGQSFLRLGMEVAQFHHEKYDGSGYPFGLSGEDIPLSARILAVADVYDALTSRRVYKPAMSHEQAAEILREGCGKHFDPDLIEAFSSREEEFARIATELGDEFPDNAEDFEAGCHTLAPAPVATPS